MHRFRSLLLVTILSAAACATSPKKAAPINADVIIRNARVFTASIERPFADAVAIRGERILAVGRETDIMARQTSTTKIIDAGGRLVIPGIHDAHLHEPGSWPAHDLEVAGENPTFSEIGEAIRKAAATLPAGTWIRGPLSFAMIDDAAADRQGLDRFAPNHPVWLENFAGHVTLLNSAAFRTLGVDEASAPPLGGAYLKDAQGRLNGRVHEYARWALSKKLTNMSDAEIVASMRATSAQLAQWGITSAQTMPIGIDVERIARLIEKEDLPVRWRIIRFPIGEILTDVPPSTINSPKVSVSGIKYILDGTPIERWAALIEPYSDRQSERGRSNFTDEEITKMLRETLRSGDQLQLHIAGDALLERLFSIMERLGTQQDWWRARVAIRHGDGLRPEWYSRARRLGVVFDQNPSHLMFPDLMRARLGDRTRYWFPLKSLRNQNLNFAIASDGPPNPFLNMMFARMHPSNPSEALTPEEAVTAYTRGGALVERTDGNKGTIEPGMLADLAILSQDILEIPTDQLPATTSVLTIVGGKVVYEAGVMSGE